MMAFKGPILVELKRFNDPDGQERVGAVASMADALAIPNLEERTRIVEQEYRELISSCAKNLESIKCSKADARLRWQMGNDIVSFQDSTIKKAGAYVCNVVEALSRDFGISQSQLSYILRLQKTYPKEKDLNPRINWSKYRELLDFQNEKSRKMCEELIISGRIKTDSEIREFKKTATVGGMTQIATGSRRNKAFAEKAGLIGDI